MFSHLRDRAAQAIMLSTTALCWQAAPGAVPVINPDQALPNPPVNTPVAFGSGVATNGRTTIVSVHSGRAAYAFRKDVTGVWVYESALESSAATVQFGVALQGRTAVVQGTDGTGTTSAFVFQHQAGQWVNTQTIPMNVSANSLSSIRFVALSHDSFLFGNPDAVEEGTGALFVYDRTGAGAYTLHGELQVAGSEPGFLIGDGPVIHGNWAVVASPGTQHVYTFHRTGGVWTQDQTLTPSTGYEGFNVDLDAGRLVTTSTLGTVVFVRQNGAWVEEQTIVDPDNPTQPFGGLAAIHGSHLVVDDTSSRRVLLFDRTGGSWTASAALGGITNGDCNHNPYASELSLALSESDAFAGCTLTPTSDPNVKGQVNVYSLPDARAP